MKIHPCNTPSVPKVEYPILGSELEKQPEGVYQPKDMSEHVVILFQFGIRLTMWVTCYEFFPFVPGDWTATRFRRLPNARVCLKIEEGE